MYRQAVETKLHQDCSAKMTSPIATWYETYQSVNTIESSPIVYEGKLSQSNCMITHNYYQIEKLADT